MCSTSGWRVMSKRVATAWIMRRSRVRMSVAVAVPVMNWVEREGLGEEGDMAAGDGMALTITNGCEGHSDAPPWVMGLHPA